MSENINNVFLAVQAETQCPFAESAAITFARPITAESSAPQAGRQLYEDIVAYVQEGIVAAPDGLAVALPNNVIGDDFESLASGFNALYRALKMHDGYDEEAISISSTSTKFWCPIAIR
jgi:hypothetical protein